MTEKKVRPSMPKFSVGTLGLVADSALTTLARTLLVPLCQYNRLQGVSWNVGKNAGSH